MVPSLVSLVELYRLFLPSLQPTMDWAVLTSIPGCQLSTWVARGRVENTVSGLESGRCPLCK